MRILIPLTLCALLSSTGISAQTVATLNGEKVEVRDIKGKYLSSSYFPDLVEIAQGNDFIVLRYASGKVEIRTESLKYIESQYFNSLNTIRTTQDYIILFHNNRKVEVRDRNLRYVSSWYIQ